MRNTPDNIVISRWFLLVTVFITGACVLVIEIIGTRILSPFFGSGIYTWSALITTTLAALSLGYALGGRLADRRPYPALLYFLCLSAGLWTMITPWLAGFILPQFVAASDMRVGIMLASIILFFPNLFFLGAIGPFAIRLLAGVYSVAGSNSGLIFSVSTVGSLLAAILSGFFLLPNYGVLTIFSLCGFILVMLAVLGHVHIGRIKFAVITCLSSIVIFFVITTYKPVISKTMQLLDSQPSFYGQVQVIQQESYKALLVDGIGQNYIADENVYVMDYIRFISVLPQLQPMVKNIKSALVIGLGAGELPMLLAKSGLFVDVVEIDPVVKAMAEKYFAFELPKEQVFIADGRYFLSHTENSYDFIVLDAFNSDQVAWHLLSREALQTAKSRLTEYGLLAINFTSELGSEDVASLQATLKEVFPYVRLFNQGNRSGLTSLVFTASGHPITLSADSAQLANQWLSNKQRVVIDAFIAGELGDLGGTTILSDDYNPISYQRRHVQMQWRREMRDYLGDDQAALLFN